MPCMPEIASKGTILKKLDFLLSDHHKRVALLPDLLQYNTPMLLTDIAQAHGAGFTRSEINHLNVEWFSQWWPYAQQRSPTGSGAVEEVVRLAIIEAINEAEEYMVPIDCYWFCHHQHNHGTHYVADGEKEGNGRGGYYQGDPEDRVEASICWSAVQVTLNLHTPPPPQRYYNPVLMTIEDPIKVVKHKERADNYELVAVEVYHMPTTP